MGARLGLIQIFTFDKVREFIESWGLQPAREERRIGFDTFLTKACFSKMLKESEMYMHNSEHGAVLNKFLKSTVTEGFSLNNKIYLAVRSWKDLEEKWDSFLRGLVKGK